jgi:hypothetical protein
MARRVVRDVEVPQHKFGRRKFVYRIWGEDENTPLYVGQHTGVHQLTRLEQHAKNKDWWDEVSRIDYFTVPEDESLVAVEEAEILSLMPKYNRTVPSGGFVHAIYRCAATTGVIRPHNCGNVPMEGHKTCGIHIWLEDESLSYGGYPSDYQRRKWRLEEVA